MAGSPGGLTNTRRRQAISSTHDAMNRPRTVRHVTGAHRTPDVADAGGGRLMDEAPRVRCLPERLDALREAWVQASPSVIPRLGMEWSNVTDLNSHRRTSSCERLPSCPLLTWGL